MNSGHFQPPCAKCLARAFVSSLLLTASLTLVAQDPIRLDLASVASLCRGRNWAAKRAHQDVTTANAVLRERESLHWGRIDFQTQYLRLNDPVHIESPIPGNLVSVLGMSQLTTPVGPQDSLHVTVEGGVPIFTGGKIHYAVRAAREGVNATSSAASDVDADVTLEAERDYLAVLLTRDVVDLDQEALKSYQDHLEHARVSYREGVVANYDVIRAEAAVKEQEKRLIEAQNQHDIAVAALRTSLALEDEAPVDIAGRLFEIEDQVDLEALLATTVKSNPMLKALDEKIAAEKDAVKVQQGDYFPQVTGVAGREIDTHKLAQTDPTWFAGVRVSLKLFTGGERQAKVSEEKARARSTEFERHHAEDRIRLAVRSAYLNLESQRSALIASTKAAELAKESFRLASKRFDVGTGIGLEVLDANVSLTAARISILQALYGIDLAYLTIHRYQGDISEIATRVQK
jgi:outer membrane protein TolC